MPESNTDNNTMCNISLSLIVCYLCNILLDQFLLILRRNWMKGNVTVYNLINIILKIYTTKNRFLKQYFYEKGIDAKKEFQTLRISYDQNYFKKIKLSKISLIKSIHLQFIILNIFFFNSQHTYLSHEAATVQTKT